MITAAEQDDNYWLLTYDNGVFVGEFVRDVDGYFYFWPNTELSGCWDQWHLYQLFHILSEINAPWDEIIQNAPL